MKAEVLTVTPQMAADWLKTNTGNRALRRTTVEHYAVQMKAGTWVLTHQGICRSASGNLIDGQHRLSAIVMAGVPVRMLVTITEDEGQAGLTPLDMGVKRTFADILHVPKKEVEIARLILEIGNGNSCKRGSVAECFAVHGVISHEIEQLPKAVLNSACCHRVGTLLAVMIDAENTVGILEQSEWFATGANCSQYWSSVEGLNKTLKQSQANKWSGYAGRLEYVIRWRAAMLNPLLKISRITNQTEAVKQVRDQCHEILVRAGVAQ